MYVKVSEKHLPNNLDVSQRDENDFSPVENIVGDEDDFEIEEDFDHIDDHILPNVNSVVGNNLLELREHFNVSQKHLALSQRKCPKLVNQIEKLLVVFSDNHL